MDLPIKELSLFSGAGGGLLGTTHLLGWETVCYVEWDDYAAQVLQARIEDGYLHDAPIWDDVCSFDGGPWRGHVDVITAGFPCQPFSVAGAMGASLDERNGWPDTARIIRDIRPQHVYLENVPGLLAGSHGYFGTVLKELASLGYDARWGVLSAADVGAPHRRDRLWIHGHADSDWKPVIAKHASRLPCMAANADSLGIRKQQEPRSERKGSPIVEPDCEDAANASSQRCEARGLSEREGAEKSESRVGCEDVADAGGSGLEGRRTPQRAPEEHPWACDSRWWTTEPSVGRVADGVASRVDRIRAIGNGQVPLVASAAWEKLTEVA